MESSDTRRRTFNTQIRTQSDAVKEAVTRRSEGAR
jgi:hypothetical protein